MYIPAIDGLRAIAIISVLLVHAGTPGASLGWLGVDLFFVLSGFLITTLLVTENIKHGRINLFKFMGRRALRLFPAYYLYVTLITLSIYLGIGTLSTIGQWEPSVILGSLWGYFNNYIPRGGFWEYDKLLIHLWSLSIEEQYYLIWPLLLVVVLRMRNNLLIPFLLVVALLVTRMIFSDSLDFDDKIYTRGFALFVGSYIGILCLREENIATLIGKYKSSTFIVVISMIAILAMMKFIGYIDDSSIRKTPIVILDIAIALMVASVWYGNDGIDTKILAYPALVYIGKISYGIYLYHMFSHFIVWDVTYLNFDLLPRSINYAIRLSLYFSLSIFLAMFSYKYIEAYFLNMKSKLR